MDQPHMFDPDCPYMGTSDTRHSNGYPMPRPELESWLREHGRQTPTVPVLEGPDTERPSAQTRWPTLEAIGIGAALDVVEAVAAFNQGKHPGAKWAGMVIPHHDAKSTWHLVRAQLGEPLDQETGLQHRAHAALRLLMSLGLEIEEK